MGDIAGIWLTEFFCQRADVHMFAIFYSIINLFLEFQLKYQNSKSFTITLGIENIDDFAEIRRPYGFANIIIIIIILLLTFITHRVSLIKH